MFGGVFKTDLLVKFKTRKSYNSKGHAHELTFTCYKNQSFFTNERTCIYLLESFKLSKIKYDYDIWAYVIMPDHVHLLIFPRSENYSIFAILLSIKQSTSRRELNYIRKYGPNKLKFFATGQKNTKYRFWQDGGGYDKNVTITKAIINIVKYIHNNPVRIGFVDKAIDWKWSSAREWSDRDDNFGLVDKESFPSF